jgi:hypothetical protein
MSRDFDAEIAQAEQEAEALKPQMADALAAWLDVAAPWAARVWSSRSQGTGWGMRLGRVSRSASPVGLKPR